MEIWSDEPVLENFKVKFFLDTNILAYLIDNTYSGLTKAIDILKNSEFVYLVSSKFVIFEFVGVRKKEHYLKNASTILNVDRSTFSQSESREFTIPGVDFNTIQSAIKVIVEQELEAITNDFGIVYSDNLLHDDLLKPTFDICLSSKISKEDSLILVSSLLPEPSRPEAEMHLLSKDGQFTNSYRDANINSILTEHSLIEPKLESISNVRLSSGTNVNFTNSAHDNRLDSFIPEKIFEMIKCKNYQLHIGDTFTSTGDRVPNDVVCFKLILNKSLPNNIFVTIIARDLSFIYSSKHSIQFWHNGNAISEEFLATDEARTNISFKLHDGNNTSLSQEQMNRLREEGHAVYIHPDSVS